LVAEIPEELREVFVRAGQGHVFGFADRGIETEGHGVIALVEQLRGMDVGFVNELFEATTKEAAALHSGGGDSAKLEAAPEEEVVTTHGASAEDKARWRNLAIEAISRGEIGIIVLAGGQGTRLGSSLPKAAYDAGLPSGKVIAAIHAEKIQRLRALAASAVGVAASDVHIPWYIMTSPQTHEATIECLSEHAHFGLPKEDILLFQQGELPCLSPEGKILLESATRVAMAPDGNGGIYRALHKSGCIADMVKRGVKLLHVYAVDNLVSKVADPVFLGLCLERGADVGNKVVPKTDPHEKVGVLCKKDGKYAVVEYSDMPDSLKTERVGSGALKFRAGNICVHAFSIDFLLGPASPEHLSKVYHIASKAIPIAHPDTGLTLAKEDIPSPNGIKLESFIFDVFEAAERMVLLEVSREDEFSPVKNAPGSASDSPDTARALLSEEGRRWLEAAGVTVEGDGLLEISPLVSYGGEGLDVLAGSTLVRPFHLTLASGVSTAHGTRSTLPSGVTLVTIPGQSRPVSEQLKMPGNAVSFTVYAIE
jgi:UDP-N-acetylglucosamine/UDP-N-acetylgalactosamine diphosphorylase